jgi:hypothetical protein
MNMQPPINADERRLKTNPTLEVIAPTLQAGRAAFGASYSRSSAFIGGP